jgi:signal transduction histidine kinase
MNAPPVARVSPELDDRVLILAPAGRDAALLETTLAAQGYRVDPCGDAATLAGAIAAGAGTAILTEEALGLRGLDPVIGTLHEQAPWSDFPILLLTSHEQVAERTPSAQRLVEALGNVTIIERPVRIMALLSSVRAALRARRRQYEARALFASERAARAEAEQANLAKDNFLAVLSHELRTPLTAVMGWARMLDSGVLDRERAAVALATIIRNATLQARLIEDLLDVSRIANGKLTVERRPLDFADVVHAAVEAVRPAAAAAGIELGAIVVPAPVLGDVGRLQQVLDNLLSNALKFTRAGGRIDVALAHDGAVARLTVSDTGIGIAPDFLPHIFDRFRQAETARTRSHGGLGLGLTIVHQIVAMHDGTIRATSAGLDAGACFIIELPLATAMDGSTPGRDPVPAPVERLRGLRILLVEDEQDTRAFLSAVLEGFGAIVTAVESAPAAMRALAAAPPDIIISDIGLPTEDGYSLVRRIRALPDPRIARVPAVALTAFTAREDVSRARDAGFQAHLGKPTDAGRLAATLARLAG